MNRTIRIIGVPTDLGQSLRGVDMGPGAVRYAGLKGRLERIGYTVEDVGNIVVPVRDTVKTEENIWFLPTIRRICEDVYSAGRKAREDQRIPIFIGGDHSVSIGTVGGVTHDGPAGVIWVDAHGDFNTHQTSPSGNIHGMSLAALVGLGDPGLVDLGRPGAKLRTQDVVMIGVRDLDPDERLLLKQSGICVYTMRDIDERGMANIAAEAIKKLSHVQRIHVSLDLDSLDPTEAPGVGTPSAGGITYREAQLLMELLSDTRLVQSVDVVEVNPILDERNETATIAVELVESLFGKSIL